MITLDNIKELKQESHYLSQIFDEIRIIEGGGTHNVCDLCGDDLNVSGKKCYEFWNRSEKCQNCVSKQASQEERQMVKLEYFDEKYYLVIAKPMIVEGKKYIVEFMTNITTQLVTGENQPANEDFVSALMRQLERVSSRDAFSGLYNKNHFQKLVEAHLQDEVKKNQPLYVALLDIDNFKKVNDTYGHARGDEILLDVAQSLGNYIYSGIGTVGRFGGDEFCIVFNENEEDKCKEQLELLKERIGERIYEGDKQQFRISISYGLKNISGCENFRDVIHEVDQELYAAKEFKPTFESKLL